MTTVWLDAYDHTLTELIEVVCYNKDKVNILCQPGWLIAHITLVQPFQWARGNMLVFGSNDLVIFLWLGSVPKI